MTIGTPPGIMFFPFRSIIWTQMPDHRGISEDIEGLQNTGFNFSLFSQMLLPWTFSRSQLVAYRTLATSGHQELSPCDLQQCFLSIPNNTLAVVSVLRINSALFPHVPILPHPKASSQTIWTLDQSRLGSSRIVEFLIFLDWHLSIYSRTPLMLLWPIVMNQCRPVLDAPKYNASCLITLRCFYTHIFSIQEPENTSTRLNKCS